MNELLSLADLECKNLWDGLWLGYTESLGLPLLRHEVASLYDGLSASDVRSVFVCGVLFISSAGINCSSTGVRVTGDDCALRTWRYGIDACTVAAVLPVLTTHADHVVCMSPGYQSLSEIAASRGCEVTEWRVEEIHQNDESVALSPQATYNSVQQWTVDIDRLEAQVSENTAMIVVRFAVLVSPSPHAVHRSMFHTTQRA